MDHLTRSRGLPRVICTDNGKKLCGKAMAILAHVRGVDLRLSIGANLWGAGHFPLNQDAIRSVWLASIREHKLIDFFDLIKLAQLRSNLEPYRVRPVLARDLRALASQP